MRGVVVHDDIPWVRKGTGPSAPKVWGVAGRWAEPSHEWLHTIASPVIGEVVRAPSGFGEALER